MEASPADRTLGNALSLSSLDFSSSAMFRTHPSLHLAVYWPLYGLLLAVFLVVFKLTLVVVMVWLLINVLNSVGQAGRSGSQTLEEKGEIEGAVAAHNFNQFFSCVR